METPTNPASSVIIADDDPMIRSVLRSKLESLGVTVLVASHGLEAVELASKVMASLIMLDIRMPQLDGLLACLRIRQLPGNAQTPIVILTAACGEDVETLARRVGATAFLTKPFRPASMLQMVSRFLPMDDVRRIEIQHSAELANRIGNTSPDTAWVKVGTGPG